MRSCERQISESPHSKRHVHVRPALENSELWFVWI